MSVRLQFPRGGFFSFERQFVVGGAALNLSGGTLVAYLKASPDDADADALATLTIAAVDATQGTVLISITAAQTASLPLGVAAYWEARATVGGATYVCEGTHGPVVLTPLQFLAGAELDNTGIDETLVPDETGLTLVPQYQPLDATLTALAAVTTAADKLIYATGVDAFATADLTAYGRSLIACATAAAARTALGLVIGTDVQAYSANLTTFAGITPGTGVAAALAVNVGTDGAFVVKGGALGTPSSGVGTNLTALNATQLTSGTVPTARLYTTAVGYNITGGANLDALAGLTSAANKLPYFTGSGTAAVTDFSASGRTLVNASALTAAGLSLTNGAAIDALGAVGSNGGLYRTAANTYAARTITGTAGQVTVTNGDGVAGAPTLSLPTALTGINSITSVSGQNLVLSTGTFGASMTVSSSTGAVTFASIVAAAVGGAGSITTGGGIYAGGSLIVNGGIAAGVSNLTGWGANDIGGTGAFESQFVESTAATKSWIFRSDVNRVNAQIDFVKTAAAPTRDAYIDLVPYAANVAQTGAWRVHGPNAQVSTAFTTASTSTTTGAFVCSGGIGIAGAGWFGGAVASTVASSTGVRPFESRSASPRYGLYNTGGAADEKLWDISQSASNILRFRAVNDADSAATNWMSVSRTGTTINSVTFDNGVINISSTVEATSSTGALVCSGGGSFAKKVFASLFGVGANQVVGARITGYTAMTGSPDKATAYATGSVTLAQLAGRVAQLQADLTTHGLIGA